MFKVTVRCGVSHKHIAVTAQNAAAAEAVAQGAGYSLTGAATYPIDAYGARFCDAVLGTTAT